MSTAEVVVGRFICPAFHITEVLAISPVVSADGQTMLECLIGSSADFCAECDQGGVVNLDFRVEERELDNDDAVHLYGVRRMA